jgi:hypothetical protein
VLNQHIMLTGTCQLERVMLELEHIDHFVGRGTGLGVSNTHFVEGGLGGISTA